MANTELEELKLVCEEDLYSFCSYVNPHRVYGDVHLDLMRFFSDIKNERNKLALIPRDHQKSHIMAMWVAWWITKNPDTTILYLSATAGLAEKQLDAIKLIFESKRYRALWPDMIKEKVSARERWRNDEICVDHPLRKEKMIRDATVATGGIGKTITGLHFSIVVSDDVIVLENALTEDMRAKVSSYMSQVESVKSDGGSNVGLTLAVGTRYHPKDLYNIWKNKQVEIFDDDGEFLRKEPYWDIFERQVETNGEFLWPRAKTKAVNGVEESYGFNNSILARKKSGYTDTMQFYAQYYNDPNSAEGNRIKANMFQYYDRTFINKVNGSWKFKERQLNIYASIDFAYSLNKKADYTAVVVIAIDTEGNIFVLDIDRFKTDSISEYFNSIARLHDKWEFNKLRAETTAAQSVIVRDLKNYVTKSGLILTIEEHKPTRANGNKEERISAALDHKYENGAIWHYRGGLMPDMEEELLQTHPVHDDMKDAFASAVEIAVKPMRKRSRESRNKVVKSSRFGWR
jgi:hypothetical protein